MGRFAFRCSAVFVGLLSCSLLISCSSSSVTQVTNNVVPAIVTLTPSSKVSLEVGKTISFSAAAENGAGLPVVETFSFQSTAPNIVTVADTGLACAGTWDSLTAPSVCTPGPSGIAEVTAVANGVPSSPVTVFVHQHVTSVVIQPFPGQPPTLSTICFSKAGPNNSPESTLYEAFAFNGGTDITSSVGLFEWQSPLPVGASANSVSLLSAGVSAPLNQEIAQANTPGSTLIVASAGGVNSQPLPFTTCPVQTISISAQNFSPGQRSFVIGSGTGITLNAIVTDSIGRTLTGVPLLWNSNNPVSVVASGTTSTVFGSTASVSGPSAGQAAITASCTPPSCNGGIIPSMPIYPICPPAAQAPGCSSPAISVVVPPSSSNPVTPTVYVSSIGCNTIATTCTTQVVPITRASTGAPFTAGTPVALPFAPNSALFDHVGANEYFGVDSTAFGTKGAMVLSGGSSASPMQNVAGKPLAVSPDGTTVIFSDTGDSPQQVLICIGCASSSRNVTRLLLCDPAATTCSSTRAAAAFSPDSLKAYIVSGNPCPGTTSAGCLLIYSKLDAPQFIQLPAAATDAAFIGNGMLGYLAGGSAAGATLLSTCIHPSSTGLPAGNAVSAPAQFLLPLPDGQSVLALSPPNFSTITATITPTLSYPANVGLSGCPAPRGFLSIANTVNSAGSLGTGAFTPSQFFLSPDGTMAYVLGAPSLPFLIQFNLTTGIPFEISLTGNATPLSASLSPAGDLLFVGATDSTVHVINTSSLADIQQVTFPFPQNSMCVGPGTPVTQVQTQLAITDALQSGSSTTYSYNSLTGPALQTGETVLITGMATFGNNGRFTITSLSTGTFTVSNAGGATESGQNGTGISGTICTPDLVLAKP